MRRKFGVEWKLFIDCDAIETLTFVFMKVLSSPNELLKQLIKNFKLAFDNNKMLITKILCLIHSVIDVTNKIPAISCTFLEI